MSAGAVVRCWLALMVLLALTTGLAFAPLGSATLFVSLSIAVAKALLVLLLFMEVKGGNALVRAFAAAGFFWLGIMIDCCGLHASHRCARAARQPRGLIPPGQLSGRAPGLARCRAAPCPFPLLRRARLRRAASRA